MAEAVFIDQMNKLGLNNLWEVDSAALIGYHTGKNPHHKTMATLSKKGISNYTHKARPVSKFLNR